MNTQNNQNMPEIVNRLRDKDQNYAKLSKRFQYVYFAFIPIYVIMIIAHLIQGEPLQYTLSGVFYLLGMLSFAFIFRYYSKHYNTINYAEPTLIMLKKAAKRYKPFQRITLVVLIPLVFINLGLTLSSLEDHTSILTIQLFFWGALSFGLIGGIILWYVKYKPMRDDILKLIADLEG